MTQASNKVDWCLEKAKKELQQGKKHRGLVKREPDMEEARNHITKAEHNLSAITYFDKGGFSDWSMSVAFYSIYHCFLAIAAKFGYESRNQECTIALIKSLKETNQIDLDNRFIRVLENYDEKDIQNVIGKREFYTYGTTLSVEDKEEIKKSIQLCKDCILQTRKILFQ
ncbi:hypothetical protein HYX19_01865 [Candidatus Woesearchaeota archaeon]|nr:hypothetical protein [Candidatus Woesearchaeota archaeon]